MRLTYLGTAAAEGFPAVFCRCAHCTEARRLGGKNIRTRSQALVNDDLLIDLPADTYAHFLGNGIEGDAIRYLLLTHAHQDHLYPDELKMRAGAFAHDMRAPVLSVFCSAEVAARIGRAPVNTEVTVLAPYETQDIGDYRVTALPARHEEGAMIYLIEGERTLLYAHDTGYPYPEVRDYLEGRGITLDMISLDCTNIDIPISDEGRHMGFPNIGRLIARLREGGVVGESTAIYVNHFSHNACPLQERLEAMAAPFGYFVAYDGLSTTL